MKAKKSPTGSETSEQPPAKEATSRLNLEQSEACRARLERLFAQTRASSLKQVILDAVAKYQDVVDAHGEITIIEQDGMRRNVKIII